MARRSCPGDTRHGDGDDDEPTTFRSFGISRRTPSSAEHRIEAVMVGHGRR